MNNQNIHIPNSKPINSQQQSTQQTNQFQNNIFQNIQPQIQQQIQQPKGQSQSISGLFAVIDQNQAPQSYNMSNQVQNPLQASPLSYLNNQIPPQQNINSLPLFNNNYSQIQQQQVFQAAPGISNLNTNVNSKFKGYSNHFSKNYSPNSNVFGGNINNSLQKFDDDDEIETQKDFLKKEVKKSTYNLHDLLTLKAKTNRTKLRLDKNKDLIIPVHVSFKTEDINFSLENRSNLDLVCVIDKSGSMSGEKIKLVQDSFKYLLDLLGDNDRISIVTFENYSQRIIKLTRTTPENKIFILNEINKINPTGGTNIERGVKTALEVLSQRRFKNSQSSIFLLSDGCDNSGKNAKTIIKNMILEYENKPNLENVGLHTFGYGSDTDSETMTSIADIKDGTFYFIEKLSMVDQCFVDCLGAIITSVGQNANLCVSTNSSNIFPNLAFNRGMGGKNLWTWNNSKTEFYTKVSNLVIGKSKDYILELLIPRTNLVLNYLTEVNLINVVLTAETVQAETIEIVKKVETLKINVFSDNLNETEEEIEDPDFIVDYFRLKLAESMSSAKELAAQSKYEDAKKILIDIQEEMINTKYFKNERMTLLLEEVKIALRDVQPEVFVSTGQHNMNANYMCNLKQKSAPTNVNYYGMSNNYQQSMMNSMMNKKFN